MNIYGYICVNEKNWQTPGALEVKLINSYKEAHRLTEGTLALSQRCG